MPFPLLLIPAAPLAASAISSITASTALLTAAGATSTAISSTSLFFGLGGAAFAGAAATGSYFTFFSRNTDASDVHAHKSSKVRTMTEEQIESAVALIATHKHDREVFAEEMSAAMLSLQTAKETLQISTAAIVLSTSGLKTTVEAAGVVSDRISTSLPVLQGVAEKSHKDLEEKILKLAELNTLLSEKDEELIKAQTEIGKLREQLDTHTSSISELHGSLDTVTAENEKQKATITRLEEQVIELKESNVHSRQSIDEYKKIIRELLSRQGVVLPSAPKPA